MVKFGMVTFLKIKQEQVIIVLLDLEKVIIKKGKKGHLGPTRTGRKNLDQHVPRCPRRRWWFWNGVKEGTKLLTINPTKMAICLFLVCFYTTFVFQSIFTCYLTLHFGTEALSKRTNSPVGELLFLGEMDL